jgi:hypothetical protein
MILDGCMRENFERFIPAGHSIDGSEICSLDQYCAIFSFEESSLLEQGVGRFGFVSSGVI